MLCNYCFDNSGLSKIYIWYIYNIKSSFQADWKLGRQHQEINFAICVFKYFNLNFYAIDVKFVYYEKGLATVHTDKSKVKILQNFLAFSECMTFNNINRWIMLIVWRQYYFFHKRKKNSIPEFRTVKYIITVRFICFAS